MEMSWKANLKGKKGTKETYDTDIKMELGFEGFFLVFYKAWILVHTIQTSSLPKSKE